MRNTLDNLSTGTFWSCARPLLWEALNPFFKFYPGSVFFVEYYVETKPFGFFCVTFPQYLLNILLTFVVHRICALFVIKFFSVYFFCGLECGYSCLCCPFCIFERCLDTVASRRHTNLVTYLPELADLATHLPDLANYFPVITTKM